MTAPERIVVEAGKGHRLGLPDDLRADWQDRELVGKHEYVRADIHAAALEREAALVEAAARLRAVAVQEMPDLEQCAEVMDVDAAIAAFQEQRP